LDNKVFWLSIVRVTDRYKVVLHVENVEWNEGTTMRLFFRNLTCQETLVLRNNRNIQIVYCQIKPHKDTACCWSAVFVFFLEKSVNLPLNFNTLSLLRVTSVTGAVSPAVDVNQAVSCVYCGRYIHLQTQQCLSQ